ncbi:MAG: ABC transporter ATP-binding protein, partial [Burkholderiaceae bacterium]
MLRISNLDVSIQSIDILRGVDMSLEKGQMAGLVGRNGAGKTTFIKSIMGLLKPSAGTLEFDGRDLKTVPVHERNQLGIGYMPEDRRLIPNLTVEENVLLPMWASRAPDSAERLQYVYRIIPELVGFAQRRGSQLSGGQQKLVALGRALMTGRQLLLLDEPFEGVAPALAQRLAEVISG